MVCVSAAVAVASVTSVCPDVGQGPLGGGRVGHRTSDSRSRSSPFAT